MKIIIENAPKIKSVGFIVNFDNDLFIFVSGEFSVNGEVSEFIEGTGVIAFDEATDINKEVAIFTLKAKAKATLEEITVKTSLIDETDKTVEIEKTESVTVTVQ